MGGAKSWGSEVIRSTALAPGVKLGSIAQPVEDGNSLRRRGFPCDTPQAPVRPAACVQPGGLLARGEVSLYSAGRSDGFPYRTAMTPAR